MLDRKLEAKLSKDGTKVSLERRGEDYAGVGRRLVAGFADWVVAMVVGAVGGLFVSIAFIVLGSVMRDPHGGANMATVGAMFLYPPATLAVATLVHLFFGIRSSRRGDTPGHRSVGLKITSVDGSRVGWPRALARQFMGSPLLVLLYVMGILYVANNYFFEFLLQFSLAIERTWWDSSDWIFIFIPPPITVALFVAGILVAINHASMVFDGQGRGLHDLIAGTVVIKSRVV